MTGARRTQRRARKIAMSGAEVDAFLAEQRVCRVATGGPSGPHATPLWFAWDGEALWFSSLVRSQRWTDLVRDPRAGIVVDDGIEYLELRGVELTGRVEVVGDAPRTDEGDAPRTDESAADAAVRNIEATFARKYFGDGAQMPHDGRHGWLRMRPDKIVSWDFRKLAEL